VSEDAGHAVAAAQHVGARRRSGCAIVVAIMGMCSDRPSGRPRGPIPPSVSVARTAAIVLAVACAGDGPSDPPAAGVLAVTPDSAVVTAIGQPITLMVTRDGQPVASWTLTPGTEQRWLDDRAVVDAAELAAARIVSSAPGRAVVRVSAGSSSDSVIVVVRPGAPLVVDWRLPGGRTHLGERDTVALRGYGMDKVVPANLAIANGSVTVHAKDSATLRFTVPAVAPGPTCAGVAPALGLELNGIGGVVPAGLTRMRTDEVVLERGEAKRLGAAEAVCIRLAPAGAVRYLLAHADPRLVTKAESGPEWPWPDSMTITVADRSIATSAARPIDVTMSSRALPAHAHPPAFELTHHTPHGTDPAASSQPAGRVPDGCPYSNFFLAYCRSVPWTPGEVFTYWPAATQRQPGPARVMAIRGNVVLAVFLADSAMLAPNAMARADSALLHVAGRGVELFRHVFGLAGPSTTSDESGQLLVVLEQSSGSFASWWPDPATGHGRWGKVVIGLAPNTAYTFVQSSAAWTLGIQAHEIFHTYQFRWRFDHAGPWIGALGTAWAVEGGASLVGLELLREFLNVPFLSNFTLPATTSESDPFFEFLLWSYDARDYTAGYLAGASLLRDLVQRLVAQGGLGHDDAMREVLTGALEGWHGFNEEGQQTGAGLTARMRRFLGSQWTPLDALLDWTMSQAADDLTTNPHYQNLTVRQSAPSTGTSTFRPHAVLQNGLALTVRRPPGTTGVWELVDGSGGSFAASASVAGVPAVAGWLLLRIQ